VVTGVLRYFEHISENKVRAIEAKKYENVKEYPASIQKIYVNQLIPPPKEVKIIFLPLILKIIPKPNVAIMAKITCCNI
jgi:hypothetical protein